MPGLELEAKQAFLGFFFPFLDDEEIKGERTQKHTKLQVSIQKLVLRMLPPFLVE